MKLTQEKAERELLRLLKEKKEFMTCEANHVLTKLIEDSGGPPLQVSEDYPLLSTYVKTFNLFLLSKDVHRQVLEAIEEDDIEGAVLPIQSALLCLAKICMPDQLMGWTYHRVLQGDTCPVPQELVYSFLKAVPYSMLVMEPSDDEELETEDSDDERLKVYQEIDKELEGDISFPSEEVANKLSELGQLSMAWVLQNKLYWIATHGLLYGMDDVLLHVHISLLPAEGSAEGIVKVYHDCITAFDGNISTMTLIKYMLSLPEIRTTIEKSLEELETVLDEAYDSEE